MPPWSSIDALDEALTNGEHIAHKRNASPTKAENEGAIHVVKVNEGGAQPHTVTTIDLYRPNATTRQSSPAPVRDANYLK
jgi:hypothetical protein